MDLSTDHSAICAANTGEALESIVRAGPTERSTNILDLDAIVSSVQCWQEAHRDLIAFYLPRVNNHPLVLAVLAKMGVGFSCASKEEMRSVLSFGVPPNLVRLAHPCKTSDTILYAKHNNIQRIVCDSLLEVTKVHRLYPTAQIVLRIRVCSEQKFGCCAKYDVPEIINHAISMAANIVGVHVAIPQGHQMAPLEWLNRALRDVKATVEQAREAGLNDLQELVIYGTDNLAPNTLRRALTAMELPSTFSYVIETDRGLVENAVTLVTNVQSKRVIRQTGTSNCIQEIMYFMNDGRYGSFEWWNAIDKRPTVRRMNGTVTPAAPSWSSSLWGPTCDSADVICERINLPELEVGDFLVFPAMGAYGVTLASRFNGFSIPGTVVCAQRSVTKAILADYQLNYLASV